MPADAELNVTGPEMVSKTGDRLVPLRSIQHDNINCRGRPVFSSLRCSSCRSHYSEHDNVRIKPKRVMKDLIDEMFGEEISNYETA